MAVGGEWKLQNPIPQGNTLYAIWGSSSSDVFAVGQFGTIIHYNGTSWAIMPSGTTNNLYGVWGSSGSDVFAVGYTCVDQTCLETAGLILHYDGLVWSPMISGTTQHLYGIWGSSGNDVFAVGDGGTILHYDGSAWSVMNSGTTQPLKGIWGSSGNDVFTVGGGTHTILHYDGNAWAPMTLTGGGWFDAVWGSSGNDVFAVGYSSPLIYHYEGAYWAFEYTGINNTLYGIWGSSGSDIFAVGGEGTILHYSDDIWGWYRPPMNSGTTQNLYGIWGSSASDVFAVGEYGTILHYDGSSWSPMNSGTNQHFNGIWGSSKNDVFSVGYTCVDQSCQETTGIIHHYDGSAWSPMTSGTAQILYGVWGGSGSEIFVVGTNGTAIRYNGSEWSPMTSGTTSHLHGVWGSSGSDVFAVGGICTEPIPPSFCNATIGTIVHFNGSEWSPMTSGTTQILTGIWGSSGNDVFAVGVEGTILHYDGSSWSPMNSGTTQHLYGVWGSSGSDVFAVGVEGTILHYNGNLWSPMTSGTTPYLYAIWGISGNDVFAVGVYGAIYHYDGSAWSPVIHPIINPFSTLEAIWGSSETDVFTVGSGGTILHYDDSPLSFTKTSPMNGATGQSTSLTLSWGASSGSTSYEYCYDTSNNNNCDGEWTNAGSNLSAGLSELSGGTTYYWQVRARNGAGIIEANTETWWSFTTQVTPPRAFNKSIPSNGVTGQSTSPTLTWETSSGTTSYEYCIDTTNNSSCDSGNYTSTGNNTSVGLSGLSAGTTYYWQVRARNAAGTIDANGGWWSFTTQVGLPGAFTKSSPTNGATGQSTSPTLAWGTSSGATSYEYCYDTSNNGSCDGNWVSTGSNLGVGLSGLNAGTTYYWQVRAQNAAGITDASGGWWSFTTQAGLPGAFTKYGPANGTTKQADNPTLSWGTSTGAVGYEYCYDTTNDGACSGSWTNSETSSIVNLIGLSPGTTYYWQVRAVNEGGMTYPDNGTWWSFTTQISPPGVFNKTSPLKGASGQPSNPTLSWETSSGAASYEYCYDTNNNNTCDGIWTTTDTNTNVNLSGLSSGITYYWQVKARNEAGTTEANGGNWWEFTTFQPKPHLYIYLPMMLR